MLAVIECSTQVAKSVAAVYDQIMWPLTMGFPSLELMLERDAAAAILGAVTATLHSQVEATVRMVADDHGVTEDNVDDFQHPLIDALSNLLDLSPFCEHTARWTLTTVTGHAMYAEPLDRVAATLGTAVSWHREG